MPELSAADRERLEKLIARDNEKAEEIRTGGVSLQSGPRGDVRDVTAEILEECEKAARIREAILKSFLATDYAAGVAPA
jgi:hypothetical protein